MQLSETIIEITDLFVGASVLVRIGLAKLSRRHSVALCRSHIHDAQSTHSTNHARPKMKFIACGHKCAYPRTAMYVLRL